MFRIDTDVPIPEIKRRRPRASKWPFAEMEVGHSVFAPNVKKWTALASAYRFRRKNNLKWKFLVLEVEGGVRVWRIA